jgi:hypothetical protein
LVIGFVIGSLTITVLGYYYDCKYGQDVNITELEKLVEAESEPNDHELNPNYDPNDPIYQFIPAAHDSWIEKFGDSHKTRMVHSISELRVITGQLGKRLLELEKQESKPIDVNDIPREAEK